MIERFIAMRYLRSRKGGGFAYVITWFSFIGIALGVATLIIVTSVMNGFRHELLDKIVGMKGHVVISDTQNIGIENYEKVAAKIKALDKRIINVTPQIERQAVLIFNDTVRGVLVQGMTKSSLQKKTLVSTNIKHGSIDGFKDGSVIIGRRLAELINADIDGSVKLLIPSGVVTPFGNLPKDENFSISSVFEVGMNEYDKNIIVMPLETAQSFFGLQNRVSQMEVFLSDVDSSSFIASKIARSLGPDFLVLDWQHSDASIFHAVVVEKNVMTLILSIIILVAVFNIISGLTMLTNSKVRDIAILRTMGTTRSSILKIFFMIGSFIGVLGTTIGVLIGLFVSLNIDRIKQFLEGISGGNLFSEEIYFLSQIPSKTDWVEVLYIALFSIVLCFLATIYPARKAAKLDPVEALRM